MVETAGQPYAGCHAAPASVRRAGSLRLNRGPPYAAAWGKVIRDARVEANP